MRACMTRSLVTCTIALIVAAGCHRGPGQSRARDAASGEAAPFIGFIDQIREGSMLAMDEESRTGRRRGNIWLAPSTEITLRNGSLVAASALRRGMRATVWFRGAVDVSRGTVSGTANRIVIDY